MKTNTEELLRQSCRLKSAAIRVQETKDAVICIDRILSRQSIGEKFHPGIQATAIQVERIAQDLDRMRFLLEQVAEEYESCEKRILDRAEQVDELTEQKKPRVIYIPAIIGPATPGLIPVRPTIIPPCPNPIIQILLRYLIGQMPWIIRGPIVPVWIPVVIPLPATAAWRSPGAVKVSWMDLLMGLTL